MHHGWIGLVGKEPSRLSMQPLRLLPLLALMLSAETLAAGPDSGALAGQRPRVIISSDIGGTDPDDFQSMVHLLLYADVLDIEGIISSPYGPGRREHILHVIDHYQRDYPNLKSHSRKYPSPGALRAIAKQGAVEGPGFAGVGVPTEGSRWIIHCARRPDSRTLYVLVWGGMEDLAQALHDAPDIVPKLRVYFIGGPNKMWSVDSYNYIEKNHPKLWIIEANSTYRGWFVGGSQSGAWANAAFAQAHAAGRGALGDYFTSLLKGVLKMGDSPSVGFLLRGSPEDPSQPGWGGRFVRLWDGRKTTFNRLTTDADQVEVFGVAEFVLPLPPGMTRAHPARVLFDNRVSIQAANDGRVLRFRFAPRDAKIWPYTIRSDFAGLNGLEGKFRAAPPPEGRTRLPSSMHPNWWIDDPDPAAAEGIHPGAKTVSRWREEFLGDFALRLRRCQSPAVP